MIASEVELYPTSWDGSSFTGILRVHGAPISSTAAQAATPPASSAAAAAAAAAASRDVCAYSEIEPTHNGREYTFEIMGLVPWRSISSSSSSITSTVSADAASTAASTSTRSRRSAKDDDDDPLPPSSASHSSSSVQATLHMEPALVLWLGKQAQTVLQRRLRESCSAEAFGREMRDVVSRFATASSSFTTNANTNTTHVAPHHHRHHHHHHHHHHQQQQRQQQQQQKQQQQQQFVPSARRALLVAREIDQILSLNYEAGGSVMSAHPSSLSSSSSSSSYSSSFLALPSSLSSSGASHNRTGFKVEVDSVDPSLAHISLRVGDPVGRWHSLEIDLPPTYPCAPPVCRADIPNAFRSFQSGSRALSSSHCGIPSSSSSCPSSSLSSSSFSNPHVIIKDAGRRRPRRFRMLSDFAYYRGKSNKIRNKSTKMERKEGHGKRKRGEEASGALCRRRGERDGHDLVGDVVSSRRDIATTAAKRKVGASSVVVEPLISPSSSPFSFSPFPCPSPASSFSSSFSSSSSTLSSSSPSSSSSSSSSLASSFTSSSTLSVPSSSSSFAFIWRVEQDDSRREDKEEEEEGGGEGELRKEHGVFHTSSSRGTAKTTPLWATEAYLDAVFSLTPSSLTSPSSSSYSSFPSSRLTTEQREHGEGGEGRGRRKKRLIHPQEQNQQQQQQKQQLQQQQERSASDAFTYSSQHQIIKSKNNTLASVAVQFANLVGCASLQRFWKEMDEIDAHCWVLEPSTTFPVSSSSSSSPSSSSSSFPSSSFSSSSSSSPASSSSSPRDPHNNHTHSCTHPRIARSCDYRRVVLARHVSLRFRMDPGNMGGKRGAPPPTHMRVLGPEEKAAGLRRRLKRYCGSDGQWRDDWSVLMNLKRALGMESFPQKPDAGRGQRPHQQQQQQQQATLVIPSLSSSSLSAGGSDRRGTAGRQEGKRSNTTDLVERCGAETARGERKKGDEKEKEKKEETKEEKGKGKEREEEEKRECGICYAYRFGEASAEDVFEMEVESLFSRGAPKTSKQKKKKTKKKKKKKRKKEGKKKENEEEKEESTAKAVQDKKHEHREEEEEEEEEEQREGEKKGDEVKTKASKKRRRESARRDGEGTENPQEKEEANKTRKKKNKKISEQGGIVPDVRCSNSNCSRVYHTCCLIEWLRALPSSRHFGNRITGQCPYCSQQITAVLNPQGMNN